MRPDRAPARRRRVPGLPAARALRAAARLGRDRRGAVSVEHLLWMPIYAALLGFIVDASLTFWTNGRMWDVAREAARRAAAAQLTVEEARDFALARLPAGPDYDVQVLEIEDHAGLPAIRVIVSAAGTSVAIFGALDLLEVGEVAATFTMRRETAA